MAGGKSTTLTTHVIAQLRPQRTWARARAKVGERTKPLGDHVSRRYYHKTLLTSQTRTRPTLSSSCGPGDGHTLVLRTSSDNSIQTAALPMPRTSSPMLGEGALQDEQKTGKAEHNITAALPLFRRRLPRRPVRLVDSRRTARTSPRRPTQNPACRTPGNLNVEGTPSGQGQ